MLPPTCGEAKEVVLAENGFRPFPILGLDDGLPLGTTALVFGNLA